MAGLRSLLVLHESRVPYAYQDSLGFWTIGVGHLIDKRRGGKLPDEIIDALLSYDIAEVQTELAAALPGIAALDEVRQAVIIDMCFNMGIHNLLGFQQFLIDIHKQDYAAAAAEMLKSRWATQVGDRADRLSKMMKTGTWPSEILVS